MYDKSSAWSQRIICRIGVRLGIALAALLITSGRAVAAEESSRGATFAIAAASPVLKIEFYRNKTLAQPSFTPGFGFGASWKDGAIAVLAYPTISAFDKNTLLIAPHVGAQLYFFNLGVGYQWQFRRNIANELSLYSGAPIIVLGVGITLNFIKRFDDTNRGKN